jgi:hypothetical protein
MLFPLQVEECRGLFRDRFVVQDAQEEVIAVTKTGELAVFVGSAITSMRRVNELVRVAEIMGETLTVDQLRDALEGRNRALAPKAS